MTTIRMPTRKWEVNNITVKITEELEHWLKKKFSPEIDKGEIIKLEGIPIENILENIINNHINTKAISITLASKHLQMFDQAIQKIKCLHLS